MQGIFSGKLKKMATFVHKLTGIYSSLCQELHHNFTYEYGNYFCIKTEILQIILPLHVL